MKRRSFINQLAGYSGLALIPGLQSCRNEAGETTIQTSVNPAFNPDLDVRLKASSQQFNILPGGSTQAATYLPEVLGGNDELLDSRPGSYLGPVFRVKPGDKIRVRFRNEIDGESIIHWHGLHVSPRMDGHPRFAVPPGEDFIYEFEITDRPGTYWFHPHPDKITGPQVYSGLAGMFLVEDPQQGQNNLPNGEYDLPLIIQDRTFDQSNQLVYGQNRMTQMTGFLGDQILVNGKSDQQIEVEKATYRFRVLNGSNSRIYKLAWGDGKPLTIIGTEGGLLEQPQQLPYLMLAPGERYELWVDFSEFNTGDHPRLKSLAFNPGMIMHGQGMGMMGNRGMGGMMGDQSSLPLGSEYEIVSFKVKDEQGTKKELPSRLSDIQPLEINNAVNQDQPRSFNFFMEQMQWTINGETFAMDEAAEWEIVQLGTTEVWEFINGNAQMGMMGGDGDGMMGGRGMMGHNQEQGGMMNDMMQMPHPVHIHGLQFQIIDRDVSQVDSSIWNTIKDGFVDGGWQDTFLLMPDMKVRILLEFRDFTGLYVYHCHNLEHEDMGMMRNYKVVEG